MRTVEQYQGREQTYFKHLVLERYLERVAYNIASFRPCIVYVDPFCGPWRSGSDDHSDSGFMIAIEALRKVRDGLNEAFDFRCFFVEDKNYPALERTVGKIEGVRIETRRGKFAENVGDIVRFIGGDFWFAFIDPTGWTGFGMDDIRPILQLRGGGRGELLINFMFDYINRFVEWENEDTRAQTDALFGGGNWLRELHQLIDEEGLSREEAIIELYKQRLKRAGNFAHVKTIRVLKPASNRPYFHLVYATRNLKGIRELAKVEKQFFREQEDIRATRKQEAIDAEAGLPGLFPAAELAALNRAGSPDRDQQLGRARSATYAFLKARGRATYEALIGHLLELSLIFESDVKDDFVPELERKGVVTVTKRKPTQRKVGDGCVITFNR